MIIYSHVEYSNTKTYTQTDIHILSIISSKPGLGNLKETLNLKQRLTTYLGTMGRKAPLSVYRDESSSNQIRLKSQINF